IAHDETLPAWAAPIERTDAPSAPIIRTDEPLTSERHTSPPKPAREARASSAKPAREVRAASPKAARELRRSESSDVQPTIDRVVAILGSKLAMSADDVARKTGLSIAKTRDVLKLLVASERAGTFRDGRAVKYWSRATGTRPDLGMKPRITAVQPF